MHTLFIRVGTILWFLSEVFEIADGDAFCNLVLQVDNYEIVVSIFHISHILTWYSAIVHKFIRIYPVCSTYELTKQFMKIWVKNCAVYLKKNNLYLIRARGKPTKTRVLTFWYVMVLFMKNNGIKLIRCCTVNCMYYCETIWWLCTSDSFTPFIWHIIRQTFSIPW